MKPSSRDTLWRAAVQRHRLDLRLLNSMSHDIELYGHMHNPVCVLLPPPYDSPTLVFEERELRRLVQVRARASLCQCVGRVHVLVIGYFAQLLLLHASRGDQPFQ